jgi:hypothetical protein
MNCDIGFYSLNNCTVSGATMSCNAYAVEGSTVAIPCTEAAVAVGVPDPPPLQAPELSLQFAGLALIAGLILIAKGRRRV